MWTPATALLWAAWRDTRRGLMLRLAIVTLVGAGLLSNTSAMFPSVTLVLLVVVAVMGRPWSVTPGFPLGSSYALPVSTATLVGTSLFYAAAMGAASYLIPALVFRLVFGLPFPLTVAAVVVTASLVLTAIRWSTKRSAIQASGGLLAVFGVLAWYGRVRAPNAATFPGDRWPEIFAFSAGNYALMACISAVAIAITLAGVSRQRYGDNGVTPQGGSPSTSPLASASGLARSVAVRCPTWSPLWAHGWFALRTAGARPLGVAALAVPVLPVAIWVGLRVSPPTAVVAVWSAGMATVILAFQAVLGLERKREVTDISTFEATRPIGSAPLVGLRLCAATTGLVTAWTVMATVVWASVRWLPLPDSPVRADYGELILAIPPMLARASVLQLVTLPALAMVALLTVMAFWVTLQSLYVRHGRRVVLWVLGVGGYACVLLAAALFVSAMKPPFFLAHLWLEIAAIPLAAAWFVRRAVVERVIAPRALVVALALWATLAAASLALAGDVRGLTDIRMTIETLEGGEVPIGPAVLLAQLASISLLPLAAVALAPLSVDRLRHR